VDIVLTASSLACAHWDRCRGSRRARARTPLPGSAAVNMKVNGITYIKSSILLKDGFDFHMNEQVRLLGVVFVSMPACMCVHAPHKHIHHLL